MRVREKVEIGDREYVVRELTIREIIEFFEGTQKEDDSEATDTKTFMKGQIQRLLSLALEGNYKVEDFFEMTPSKIKELYGAFKEANKVFFDIAAEMGMGEVVTGLKEVIQKEFSEVLVNSSKAAIQKPLTTVTPTSLPQ